MAYVTRLTASHGFQAQSKQATLMKNKLARLRVRAVGDLSVGWFSARACLRLTLRLTAVRAKVQSYPGLCDFVCVVRKFPPGLVQPVPEFQWLHGMPQTF